YFTLCNAGSEPDALIAVASVDAAAAEMHESGQDDNGMMSMTPVSSIDLPPGKKVSLAPGGYHVMLIGLYQPLVEGGEASLTLKFRHAPPITIKATARPPGQTN
ncbi:MAG TPA: copper chaperone PCu(A)C, partial [Parvularculaceae bacterium]|nr:copper chaperone PCu(A)C [Parvularculaceae bacterium]